MTNTLKIILAIMLGIILGFGVYKGLAYSPCYDGTPISQTPNYCFMGSKQ